MKSLLFVALVALGLSACTTPPPGTPDRWWGVTNRPGLYGGGG